MADVLTIATLAHVDGINADAVQNSFCFRTLGSSPTSTDLTAIETAVKNFYNAVPTGFGPIAESLSSSLSRVANLCTLKHYDITGRLGVGDDHGSPIQQVNWTLGPKLTGTIADLPAEMSIVCSFRADWGTTPEFGPELGPGGGHVRPRARKRGRIYIGPLHVNVMTQDTTTKRVKLATFIMNGFTQAMKQLRDDSATEWRVWSRVDAATYPVVSGWVDDAFDSTRRRGEKTQQRVFF